MIELSFSSPFFGNRLALALFHFLWQGALIYFSITLLLKVITFTKPQIRYAIHLAGLVLMATCPVVTFFLIDAHTPDQITPQSEFVTQKNNLEVIDENENKVVASQISQSSNESKTEISKSDETAIVPNTKTVVDSLSQSVFWQRTLNYIAPFCLYFWIAGVLFFSLRLLLGWRAMFRWKRSTTRDIGIETIVLRLKRYLRIQSMPLVLVCSEVTEAMAIGFLKPMVLLPASWMIDLTPQMLEAVIAHEVAHIRRHDLWVNLLQRLVEALLFYHPAIWVISNQIRIEREHCCDDMAVAMTGSRTEYVETLEFVASLKLAGSPALATAMGGRKMKLLDRVKHLLHQNEKEPRTSWGLAGIVALAIPALLWVCSFAVMPVAADEEGPKRDKGEASAEEDKTEAPEERRDRERPPRRDRERGDRDRGEGDRERGDRPPRRGDERGDRGPREGRGGERDRGPRDGDRPERPDFKRGPRGERDGEDRPPRRDGDKRRDGDREGRRPERRDDFRKGGSDELMRLIRDLHNEVRELRREVAELRRAGKGRGEERDRDMKRDRGPRDREFDRGDREFDRDREDRPRGPREERNPMKRKEGDPTRYGDFKRERDGDKPVRDQLDRDRPEEKKAELEEAEE